MTTPTVHPFLVGWGSLPGATSETLTWLSFTADKPTRVLSIFVGVETPVETTIQQITSGARTELVRPLRALEFMTSLSWSALSGQSSPHPTYAPDYIERWGNPQVNGAPLRFMIIEAGQAFTLKVRGPFEWIAIGGQQRHSGPPAPPSGAPGTPRRNLRLVH